MRSQPKHAVQPLRWSGHWIGPEARALEPADVGAVARRAEGRAVLPFAVPPDVFPLDGVPAQVPARLTADSRYVLWVNGQEVGRGPARSQPARQRYDSYDLAPYLLSPVRT